MTQPIFIGSNIYRGSSYGRHHPLSIPRVPAVIDLCRALGWLDDNQYRQSPKVKPSALTGFHTPDYIAALVAAEASQSVSDVVRGRYGLGTPSNPVFPEMYSRPATATGGGLLAAELVRKGGVVFNPGGGTHHGLADRASGFCYINEPVITIRRLLDLGLTRVAYVDIDAHHCDGVEAGFSGSEQVRMISIHEERRWPFSGAETDRAGGASFNLPVPRGFNDSEFDLLLNEVVLPAVQAFRPEAIFLQCGVDAVTEDPLSRLALSNQCHVRAAMALQPMSPRLIVSGGGGYNPWTAGRAWTGVWAGLNGFEVPDRLPPKAEAIQRDHSWARKGRPSELLLTTLSDRPRPGPIRDEIRALADRHRNRLVAGG